MSEWKYAWFLSGPHGWDDLEKTRGKVDSILYGYCETAADEGKVYTVSLQVAEVSLGGEGNQSTGAGHRDQPGTG